MHAVDPGLVVPHPCGQDLQDGCPVSLLNVPALQDLHVLIVVLPFSVEYVPLVHSPEQDKTFPVSDENLPAGQNLHASGVSVKYFPGIHPGTLFVGQRRR